MMLSRFLAILPLVGLAFATLDEWYGLVCQVVEVAISNASNVYYPGKSELLSWLQGWTSYVDR